MRLSPSDLMGLTPEQQRTLMNQELAGGTLGVRAAESAMQAWSSPITTSNGVFQVNRYTGDVRRLDIPVEEPTPKMELHQVWDPSKKAYVWKYLNPRDLAGQIARRPVEAKQEPLVEVWDPDRGAFVYMPRSKAVGKVSRIPKSAGGSKTGGGGGKVSTAEYKLLVQSGWNPEDAAVYERNKTVPDSARYFIVPGEKGEDVMPMSPVYNPKTGKYQPVTMGDLRAVIKEGKAKSLEDAYLYIVSVAQRYDPVKARSPRLPITAFGGQ